MADTLNDMKKIKDALAFVPREELEKIILFHFFGEAKNIDDMVNLWLETNKNIGAAILEHLPE
jgi:hypothetical protein